MRIRFSRKKLKRPDEFLTLTDKIVHFCIDNRVVVSGIILGAIILLGAFFGIRYNQQVDVARMESLLVDMENIKTQGNNKQPSQVITDLESALGKFSESGQKQRAKLLLGDVYYQNEQFDKSIALYDDVIRRSSVSDLSNGLAQLGLAYSYEGKKEYKKAMGVYRSIIDHKNASVPLLPVYLDLVRCYESDNDLKNALLVLREAKNKFQNSTDMEKIDRQIRRLEKLS